MKRVSNKHIDISEMGDKHLCADQATIKHTGVVKNIEKGRVRVEIISHSACSSCRARVACGMSESATKIIDVYTQQYLEFTVGDSVRVGITKKMGVTSLFLAYVIPLLLLILSLIIGIVILEQSQGVVALMSLFMVGIYYAILYLLRDKIEDKIKFSITKE